MKWKLMLLCFADDLNGFEVDRTSAFSVRSFWCTLIICSVQTHVSSEKRKWRENRPITTRRMEQCCFIRRKERKFCNASRMFKWQSDFIPCVRWNSFSRRCRRIKRLLITDSTHTKCRRWHEKKNMKDGFSHNKAKENRARGGRTKERRWRLGTHEDIQLWSIRASL